MRTASACSGQLPTEEYIDKASGKSAERNAYQRLFTDASQRHFDVVLVWALDRFSRQGDEETFNAIRQLREHGVQFESFTEAHFRTTGAAGELMLAVAAWIAEQERPGALPSGRAPSLARARRAGKTPGRPRRDRQAHKLVQVRNLRDQGMSLGAIARQLKLPKTTVARIAAGG